MDSMCVEKEKNVREDNRDLARVTRCHPSRFELWLEELVFGDLKL